MLSVKQWEDSMEEKQRLKTIAELFGGTNDLARAVKMAASGLSRRISGDTKITERDWLCIEAAVARRREELQRAIQR
jgi:hypothetical protein